MINTNMSERWRDSLATGAHNLWYLFFFLLNPAAKIYKLLGSYPIYSSCSTRAARVQ